MDVIKHKKGLLMNIKENFFIYLYREVLTLVFWFIATGALLAARRVRILLINQCAICAIMLGMKYLQFTDHRRC
jgi:hypothetical protein